MMPGRRIGHHRAQRPKGVHTQEERIWTLAARQWGQGLSPAESEELAVLLEDHPDLRKILALLSGWTSPREMPG